MTQRRPCAVAAAGYDGGYLDTVHITWADTERGRGPTGTAIRTGQPVVVRDTVRDPNFGPWRADALRRGYASTLALPLNIDGGVAGAPSIYAADVNAFDAEEVNLLSELADDLAYGMVALRTRIERQRAEAALQGLSSRHEAILTAVPEIIMEVNREKVYVWANRAGLEFFGDDVVGRGAAHYFADAQDTYVQVQLLFDGDEGTFYVESWQRRRDGEKRLLAWWCRVLKDADGQVVGALSTARDITEQNRAEQEQERLESRLRQAQKMEAVGQLAGGVAHDFNNILTAILGNVELLRGELEGERPGGPGALLCLEQLERAAQHAAGLTRQLLAFSRHQTLKREVLDLHQVLTGMEAMLRRVISENITLEFVRGAERALVCGDAGQFEQVIMNLTVNARDAMPRGGRLVVTTDDVVLEDAYVALHPESHSGPHVLLTVSDTGGGMTPEVLERIFEPFFTTKPAGQGTGLGLATVYAIVKQLDGHVTVYSEPGFGTTFRVYLPAFAAPEVQPAATIEEERALRGSETILVCEDDATVRKLATHFLRGAGYTLLDAAKGSAALELAAAYPDPIHLLVTDVIMPDINGRQLADALTAARPGLKTLFISGYTSDVIAHHGVLDPGVELLEKPFGRRGLLAGPRTAGPHIRVRDRPICETARCSP